jgi:DNA mismatch endonuclease (patch repair protein)
MPKRQIAARRDRGTSARTETPAQRSAIMRAVKSRDTKPELVVRKLLWSIAPGYRLYRADLPGKPDIVYARRRLAIFVHGCFWHGHDCARGARAPRTNAAYWSAKIARNRARDEANLQRLAAQGWRTLVIHECELKDIDVLRSRLGAALA